MQNEKAVLRKAFERGEVVGREAVLRDMISELYTTLVLAELSDVTPEDKAAE
jgi:hypothetical protein